MRAERGGSVTIRAKMEGPESTQVVRLSEIPSLGGLYASAVSAQAVAAVKRRTQNPTSLPAVRYEATGVTPDLTHLNAYQHLLGETASDELPAGFVHVVAFPVAVALMTRSDFPMPLLGLVHLANDINQYRPIGIDEVLDIDAWAEHMLAHNRGTQVDLVVEVRSAGELVWRGVSTYLAKGRKLPDLPTASPAPRLDFDDTELPTSLWNLNPEIGRAYARISGDVNPIHLSTLSAKPFGFARAIAHGMYTAARALAVIGPERAPAFNWRVDFTTPAYLPSTVAFRAVDNDGLGCDYFGWNLGSGKPHFTGWVRPLTTDQGLLPT